MTVANAAEPADMLAVNLTRAWNSGDAVAWGQQFWPDARLVNVIAHVYEGRDEMVTQHARIFGSIYKGSHITMIGVRGRQLGPDHALIELDSAMTGWSQLPPGVVTVDGAIRSHMVLAAERRAGEWKIAYAQNTAYTPLPTRP